MCVFVFDVAVLKPRSSSKDTVQHGCLVSRVDTWEQSEQRQLADMATGVLVSVSSVISTLVSNQRFVAEMHGNPAQYTHTMAHPPSGVTGSSR